MFENTFIAVCFIALLLCLRDLYDLETEVHKSKKNMMSIILKTSRHGNREREKNYTTKALSQQKIPQKPNNQAQTKLV